MAHPATVHTDTAWLVPFDGGFRVADAPTEPPEGSPRGKAAKAQLGDVVDDLRELQRVLYAHDRHAVLLVFQAMDAAGKDSTIRHVLSGINPAGCQVFSFKKPSALELEHDFLWRTASRMPERGRIGVFNRSYYEEVLVVRVHPEILKYQRVPQADLDTVWQARLQSIADHERHLAHNGTLILKFWLNVSRAEQRRRFIDRLDQPEKNWKFSVKDVEERQHWDAYMRAYEAALRATSRPWAPWFAVPADDKRYMRLEVGRIIRTAMRGLDLHWPVLGPAEKARFAEMRRLLG